MEPTTIVEAWGTLGVTGVMAVLFGFMITNIIKSQHTQNEALDKLAVSQAKSEETGDNVESILLKLLLRLDNIRWLFQIIVGVGFVVMGYLRIENRIGELERRIELSDTSIEELVSKHMIKEEKERNQMEERISFFEKELNLNPFSWKRKKK